MLSRVGLGPVFFYEWLTAARRWQMYAIRALFLLVILAVLFFVWWMQAIDHPTQTLQDQARLGSQFFFAIIGTQLLASVTQGYGNDEIASVDLTTFAASIVGTTSATCIYGLAAYGSMLFGYTCGGDVLQIDPRTPMARTRRGKITPLWPKLAYPRIMAATIVTS